jgi:hypothetical protein
MLALRPLDRATQSICALVADRLEREADDLDDATQKARGCPILSSGGTIEVYETFNAM